MVDRAQPISEPIAPPKKETAWERGLKLAREVSTLVLTTISISTLEFFLPLKMFCQETWNGYLLYQ